MEETKERKYNISDLELMQNLIQAIKFAGNKYPVWGAALDTFRAVISTKVPTLAVTQTGIMFCNPDFCMDIMTDKETGEVLPGNLKHFLIHEVLHHLLGHFKRWKINKILRSATPEELNVVGDAEDNDILQDLSKMIRETGITPQLMGWPRHLTMEEYYTLLQRDIARQKQKYPFRYGMGGGGKPPDQNQQQSGGGGQGDQQQQQQGGQRSSSSSGKGSNKSQKDGDKKNSSSGGESGQDQDQNPQEKGDGSGPGNDKEKDQDSKNSDGSNSKDPGQDNEYKGMSKSERIIDNLIFGRKIRELIGDMDLSKVDENNQTSENLRDICDMKAEELRAQGKGSEYYHSDTMMQVPKKKYPWYTVLKNIVTSVRDEKSYGFEHMTYKKFNSRWAAVSEETGVLVPSWYQQEERMNIVVGVDVSGSMFGITEEMYSRLKSVFDSFQEDELKLTILEADMSISKVVEDFNIISDKNTLNIGRGGGTDMGCIHSWVFDKVKKGEREMPDVVVIMTDNETGWDPVIPELKDRTIVITTKKSKNCPYQQYEVEI